MPLTGKAKAKYQREYMRRRRAATRVPREPRPPPSDEPTQSEISEITYLARRPPWRNRHGTPQAWIIKGLFEDPARNDDDFLEALWRLRAVKAEQRKKRRQSRAKPKKLKPPSFEPLLPFCDACSGEKRDTATFRFITICRECAVRAIEMIDAAPIPATGAAIPQPPQPQHAADPTPPPA